MQANVSYLKKFRRGRATHRKAHHDQPGPSTSGSAWPIRSAHRASRIAAYTPTTDPGSAWAISRGSEMAIVDRKRAPQALRLTSPAAKGSRAACASNRPAPSVSFGTRSQGLVPAPVAVGACIVDFPRTGSKLVLEVDGAYDAGARQPSADATRDNRLERASYRVIRVPAALVLRKLPPAVAQVRAALAR